MVYHELRCFGHSSTASGKSAMSKIANNAPSNHPASASFEDLASSRCFSQAAAPVSTSIAMGLHFLSIVSAVEGLTSAETQTGAACAEVNTDVGAIGTLSRLVVYPIRDDGLVGLEIKLAVGCIASMDTALPRHRGTFCCTLPVRSRRSEFLGVQRPLASHVAPAEPCTTSDPSATTPRKLARRAVGVDELNGVIALLNRSELPKSSGSPTASTSSAFRAWRTRWRML